MPNVDSGYGRLRIHCTVFRKADADTSHIKYLRQKEYRALIGQHRITHCRTYTTPSRRA